MDDFNKRVSECLEALRKCGYMHVFTCMHEAAHAHGCSTTIFDVIRNYAGGMFDELDYELAATEHEQDEGKPLHLTKEDWLHPNQLVLAMIKVVLASTYGRVEEQ